MVRALDLVNFSVSHLFLSLSGVQSTLVFSSLSLFELCMVG
jgi:hypothetical protein